MFFHIGRALALWIFSIRSQLSLHLHLRMLLNVTFPRKLHRHVDDGRTKQNLDFALSSVLSNTSSVSLSPVSRPPIVPPFVFLRLFEHLRVSICQFTLQRHTSQGQELNLYLPCHWELTTLRPTASGTGDLISCFLGHMSAENCTWQLCQDYNSCPPGMQASKGSLFIPNSVTYILFHKYILLKKQTYQLNIQVVFGHLIIHKPTHKI